MLTNTAALEPLNTVAAEPLRGNGLTSTAAPEPLGAAAHEPLTEQTRAATYEPLSAAAPAPLWDEELTSASPRDLWEQSLPHAAVDSRPLLGSPPGAGRYCRGGVCRWCLLVDSR